MNELESLFEKLRNKASELSGSGQWPMEQLGLCGEAGVFKWFIGEAYGGSNFDKAGIVDGYIDLASSCLTTTFVITQRTGACHRIEASSNESLKSKLLPMLAAGELFATLGISHLTTSHRHQGKPALSVEQVDRKLWQLDGFSPWVTGAGHADFIVAGAELADGQQAFFAVPTDYSGVVCRDGYDLLALSESKTGRVEFDGVSVSDEYMIAGPDQPLSGKTASVNTGGLQTSALALGLSKAAIGFVSEQTEKRKDLLPSEKSLQDEWDELYSNIMNLAKGIETCSKDELRSKANSLAIRSTQSALIAAKGAGFVAGHDVGRWCREALFFLVWSCPQNVREANLCEFAGLIE